MGSNPHPRFQELSSLRIPQNTMSSFVELAKIMKRNTYSENLRMMYSMHTSILDTNFMMERYKHIKEWEVMGSVAHQTTHKENAGESKPPQKEPDEAQIIINLWKPNKANVYLHRPKLKLGKPVLCKRRNPDRISELPDDILIVILGQLPIKEAGRTSTLSKRWRHTWSYSPRLNFLPDMIDYESMLLNNGSLDYEKFAFEEDKYLDWVDQVVCLSNAPTVDEFKVPFDLANNSEEYINYWLSFAVKKKTKILHLNFEDLLSEGRYHPYNLSSTISSCYSLTSLHLACVNVTGEAVGIIIYNCRALESLSVTQSELLVDLKVDGPSLTLKSLKIVRCSKMKSLEISAPNLTSFYYFGQKILFNFKSFPKLSEFAACGLYGSYLINDFFDFSSCIPQIEAFKLELPSYWECLEVFPICTRLKVLDVLVSPTCSDDVFRFFSFIKACPILHKFILQLHYCGDEITMEGARKEEAPYPHKHLKIVEVVGFVGCEVDVEFFKYLMEIAVLLETVIIDPRHIFDVNEPKRIGTFRERTDKQMLTRARKVANKLSAHLKPGVDLEIL